MTLTDKGDIQINGQPYRLVRGGYQIGQSAASEPRMGGATEQEFEHTDNWTYYGNAKWYGMGWPEFEPGGPFLDGYGLDLSIAGSVKIAKQLILSQASVADSGGYVAVPLGHNWIVFIGKTSGTMWTSNNAGASWSSFADALGVGIKPRGTYGILKNDYYIGSTLGKLAKFVFNDDGTGAVTFLDMGVGGPSPNDTYVLGAYKGKLWIGSINSIHTYDGTTWTQMFTGTVDGTVIAGAVGNNVMYMMTSGPQSRLYMTDGTQLLQLAVLGSDFVPTSMVFLETLMIFGHSTDDSNTKGEVWRMEEGGIRPFFKFGADDGQDYGIRCAVVDRGKVLWGANRKSGIGVYDPDLDIYDDVTMGFYVGSTIDTVAAGVHGILQSKGVLYCGIEGSGLYKQGTPGKFRLTGSLFGANTKHINKLWGFAEIYHSALAAGQHIDVRVMKDGVTPNAWGISDTLASTFKIIPGTADYKSPYIQYDLVGDAFGADLTIFDMSLAFVEISDNPKKEWDLVIAIEGSVKHPQIYIDGTDNPRSAMTMAAELNALWNKRTTFDDVDGVRYNVIFRVPRLRATSGPLSGEMVRIVDGGAVSELSFAYKVHLVEL
ncbi:MAG TPA: hypothetical protein VFK94_06445 [Patescibacteria group bacterium]|nr:hypothetical protein [Patescibacteria group bacterium]